MYVINYSILTVRFIYTIIYINIYSYFFFNKAVIYI